MKFSTGSFVVVAAMVVSSGIVHGWWTNRWGAEAAASTAHNLLELDDGVGDWQPGPFFQVSPADMPAGCRMDSRRFESLRAGRNLVVSVTSGHPGVVAVHTPDVCYLGSGYKLRSSVSKETVPLGPDGTLATFYVADFQKVSATGTDNIRVRWAWTADGTWQAPDYPRWYFARVPLLYKLYVVHALADDDLTKDDPYRKFVAALVPALSRHFAR